MRCEFHRQTHDRQAPARWQFSLKQLFAATAGLSMFFSAMAYGGAWGAVIFLGTAGIVLICVGFWLHRNRMCEAGVVGLTLCLLLGLLLPATEGAWSGRKSVPLQFVVVDAATKEPIGGASVRIREMSTRRDYPRLPIPVGELGIEGQTDLDGQVTLVGAFDAAGSFSLFKRTCHVFFDRCWLQGSAPEYETAFIPLSRYTGRVYDLDDGLPSPIRIELKKTAIVIDNAPKGWTASQPTD